MSLWWRLQFPPFSGINPSCEDGCECILGPAVVETQEHDYEVTFNFTHNRSITITGKFEVQVSVESGVCVPKSGTKFTSLSEDCAHPASMLAGLNGDGDPLEIYEKGGKA